VLPCSLKTRGSVGESQPFVIVVSGIFATGKLVSCTLLLMYWFWLKFPLQVDVFEWLSDFKVTVGGVCN
jgi:hypothetical protein